MENRRRNHANGHPLRETRGTRYFGPQNVPAAPKVFLRDTDGQPLITRAAVANLLHCSKHAVRSAEERGELHPIEAGGVHYFSPREVLAYGEKRDGRLGAIASEAFRMFREGHGVVDAVIELKAEPEYIRGLYVTFQSVSGLLVVELPKPLTHWAHVYHASLDDFTPRRLLRALEICLSSAELRQQLETLSA